MYFIIAQIIGFLAWLVLVSSYYKKSTNQILLIQIISTVLYCINYYMLGAYSGLMICLLEVIIQYGYYKTDLDKAIFLCSIPVYLSIGLFNITTFIDILPIFSSVIDGYALTKKKKSIVIGAIISYSIWAIYDFNVKSYSCSITSIILVISNICILIKELRKS